jgi:cold shock CspA family protein/ribosome-associated translation inhibitor RaiA
MAVPVQVTFRDFDSSPAVLAHVERRAQKLETFCDHIHRCHVVVEAPQHGHHVHGPRFHCRIEMHVPGRKELIVTRIPADHREDVHAAVDDAFGDAERCLQEHMRVLQAPLGERHGSPHGVVTKIFPDRGYGFIECEGRAGAKRPEVLREVYFHRNSVVNGRFEKIAIGTRVRFSEEDGDKGPQASTVHLE